MAPAKSTPTIRASGAAWIAAMREIRRAGAEIEHARVRRELRLPNRPGAPATSSPTLRT